jgi:hypothetical protein
MNTGKERRKAKRRDILEKFSFYVCIPKLGFARHMVNDVSELGIGFTLDTLGEFTLKKDESCSLHFYMNQSLYLPLEIQVMREQVTDQSQLVGAIFSDVTTAQYKTFLTLVNFLDQLSESGEILDI